VLVVGGGPAGAVCAAHCAAAGWRTLLVERSVFPREKVCGDCLNPACWPILRRLELVDRVLALPHAKLSAVDIIDLHGRRVSCPLPSAELGEIAVKRSELDELLLRRAVELGVETQMGSAVCHVERSGQGWRVETEHGHCTAKWLIAADGRNSTVARLLNLLPGARKDRVGQQTHFPLPPEVAGRVVMRFLPEGYSGLADVGGGQANLCLVGRGENLPRLRKWAGVQFQLPPGQEWRTVTPLERGAAPPAHDGLLLVGDAARVVEPFTGEGIYYAMASGELAARCLVAGTVNEYAAEHRRLYRGRIWINRLAKIACLHPRFAGAVIGASRWWSGLMPALTRLVTRSAG
jgi:flavin-dependent dehydrogenase